MIWLVIYLVGCVFAFVVTYRIQTDSGDTRADGYVLFVCFIMMIFSWAAAMIIGVTLAMIIGVTLLFEWIGDKLSETNFYEKFHKLMWFGSNRRMS